MESKFMFSHSFIKLKAAVILIWRWFLFGLVINMLVSSANNIGKDLSFIALGKSLTYKRNNNGPKIDPCRTPCFISSHVEK